MRINSHYGNQFKNRFSTIEQLNAAKMEWAIALVKYTHSEINTAIFAWMRHSPNFAPTLGQFAKCCEDAYRNAKPEQKRLGAVKASAAVKQKQMEKLRKMLPIKNNKIGHGYE